MKRREFLYSGTILAAARWGTLEAAETLGDANPVRGMMRLFVSEIEDKPWFYEREGWSRYFDMLAAQRFNRFHLALGIGYDFLRQVTDAYFLFPYPFLVDVPSYSVRIPQLPAGERERNLETLRFISREAAARGLHFQLGLWMHGYIWENSPQANYTVTGLDRESHGPYCRDALALLLRECPSIAGVTFRIHGESGVAEGSYDFWKTVFDGVPRSGRKLEIDLHTKGIDRKMIDLALATGMPVTVSPKFWAEHMGMPYHQADIREPERPQAGHRDSGLMALSTGSRSFTRYGYADLLRADRRYQVVWRIWPGTQRLLPWADPVFAAGYSRAFGFGGSRGVEVMEPMSFKGRRGSGIAGQRARWGWETFADTYRVWGAKLADPDAKVAVAPELAAASRILPIVTTAHMPSAANNNYWPEIYTNQSLVVPVKSEYTDSPAPHTFGKVSPLDPQLFSRIDDFADELLAGERSAKYSPVEVAVWLEDLAARSGGHPIEAGTGRFFAAKFRAGVLYRVHERTGDRAALEAALAQYRKARDAWAEMAAGAKDAYPADITFGELPWLRGHWLDRLPAIDADIALLDQRLAAAKPSDDPKVRAAVEEALGRPRRPSAALRHTPPARFAPGKALALTLAGPSPAEATLWYRHVNQAERWESAPMRRTGGEWRAAIAPDYTNSLYELQYYFELRTAPDRAWLYPGFAPDLANQPYFVVRRS